MALAPLRFSLSRWRKTSRPSPLLTTLAHQQKVVALVEEGAQSSVVAGSEGHLASVADGAVTNESIIVGVDLKVAAIGTTTTAEDVADEAVGLGGKTMISHKGIVTPRSTSVQNGA